VIRIAPNPSRRTPRSPPSWNVSDAVISAERTGSSFLRLFSSRGAVRPEELRTSASGPALLAGPGPGRGMRNANMCSVMGDAGSPVVRFERAIATGRPSIVLAAANELPRPVQLRDAIRILLVLAIGEPDRFPAAAARFGSRLVSEHRLDIREAQLAFAALGMLATPDPAAGAETLCVLLERHGEQRAAEYVGDWIRSRGL
jgi:hypothetical protein